MGRREKVSEASKLRQARKQHSERNLSSFAESIGYSASYLSAVELGYLPETAEVLLAYEDGLALPTGTLSGKKESVTSLLGKAVGRARPEMRGHTTTPISLPFEGRLSRWDRREALLGMIELVSRSAPASQPIFIACQNQIDRLMDDEELALSWSQALRQALSRGVEIIHLVRLSRSREHALRTVESILPLLGSRTGRYLPLVIDQGKESRPLYDTLIVPGSGALLFFATVDDRGEGVLLLKEDSQTQILSDYCASLVEAATPLIERVPQDSVAFEDFQLNFEALDQDRYMVNAGLFSLIEPSSWHQPSTLWAKRTGLRGKHLNRKIELRQCRLEGFREQIRRFHYRDICPKSALVQLVETGTWPVSGGEKKLKTSKLSWEEVVELLQFVIDWLRTYENYELALIDDEETRLLRPAENQSLLFWVVKPDLATVLETWPLDDDGEPTDVHICIRDAQVSSAFGQHFRSIWNRIATRNRERDYVTWWLERQIEVASAKIGKRDSKNTKAKRGAV